MNFSVGPLPIVTHLPQSQPGRSPAWWKIWAFPPLRGWLIVYITRVWQSIDNPYSRRSCNLYINQPSRIFLRFSYNFLSKDACQSWLMLHQNLSLESQNLNLTELHGTALNCDPFHSAHCFHCHHVCAGCPSSLQSAENKYIQQRPEWIRPPETWGSLRHLDTPYVHRSSLLSRSQNLGLGCIFRHFLHATAVCVLSLLVCDYLCISVFVRPFIWVCVLVGLLRGSMERRLVP